MTLIVGLNLSDKIFLAADSRLSTLDIETGKIYQKHDNLQKIELIPGSVNIWVACAGSISFAKYILDKIKNYDIDKTNINNFKQGIEENLRADVHEYLLKNGKSNVTLMFAGVDKNKKQVVNGKRFTELASAHTGGQGLIRIKGYMKKHIKEGQILKDEPLDLDINSTELFSLYIDHSSFEITESKWGEVLVHGSGVKVVKETISDKIIGDFEFDPSFEDNGSGVGNDQAIMYGIILDNAKKYGIESVGGCVFPIALHSTGDTIIQTGEAYSIPIDKVEEYNSGKLKADFLGGITLFDMDHIYRIEHGTRYRLTKVSDYEDEKEDMMSLYI